MSQQPTAPESGQPRLSAPAGLAGRLGAGAPVVVQFVQFGIVGVSNTLLAFAVYTLLLKVFGVWYVAASGIGFAVGAVNGFLLNRRWTFKEHVGDRSTPLKWAVVQTCGLACNLGLVYLFVDGLGMDELVGQIPTTVIVTVLTFAANRAWTFKMHPEISTG
jgi:putative flippase GtrA